MPIDPMKTAEPVSPEMVAGGSYMPQEDGFEAPPPPKPGIADERALRGRASDVNDFSLTMSGIADGDPVGMETFDLGFFEDGTPAITINGANVPIRHEQWMSLLTMRNKTREEIRARTEFENAKMTAMEAIMKVEMATRLPNGMIPLIKAQAQFDPPGAIESLSKVYLSMQTSGGKDLMGDVSRKLQEFKNNTVIDHLTKPQGETTVQRPHPDLPGRVVEERVKQPSRRDVAVQELSKSPREADHVTAFAYMRLDDFLLDPTYRQINPMQNIGIFDRIQNMESDRYGPMSLFARLQHIAAYHKPGDWPEGSRVSMQPPPAFISDPKAGGIPDIGANMGFNALSQVEQKRYLDYLTELDRWASNAFGYNTSSLDSLMMTAIQTGQINMQRMGLAAEAAQAQPVEQTQSTPVRPVPQRSGRPRATRS